jgi:cob(I)alamin adenosyltransferase
MKQNELNNLLNSYDLQKGQMNEILEEIKQVVYYMSSYLCKSSRQKIFYEDLNCKYLNFESIQLINNSIKKYVDQHNRIKKELE